MLNITVIITKESERDYKTISINDEHIVQVEKVAYKLYNRNSTFKKFAYKYFITLVEGVEKKSYQFFSYSGKDCDFNKSPTLTSEFVTKQYFLSLWVTFSFTSFE